jgi:hypothetical protein
MAAVIMKGPRNVTLKPSVQFYQTTRRYMPKQRMDKGRLS